MRLQSTKADETGCKSEGGFVHEIGAFKAQTQTAKALEPGEGALHHPSVHAQPAAVFLTPLGQEGHAATLPPLLSQRLAIMGAVSQSRYGLAARGPEACAGLMGGMTDGLAHKVFVVALEAVDFGRAS